MQAKHNDSFKIMEYKCEKCGCSEFVWNSRNSVSPYIICCRACNGKMAHINWPKDQVRPDFKPAPGMRYFANFTRERAEKCARERITAFANTEFAIKEGTERYNEVFISLVDGFINNECAMDLLIAGG